MSGECAPLLAAENKDDQLPPLTVSSSPGTQLLAPPSDDGQLDTGRCYGDRASAAGVIPDPRLPNGQQTTWLPLTLAFGRPVSRSCSGHRLGSSASGQRSALVVSDDATAGGSHCGPCRGDVVGLSGFCDGVHFMVVTLIR